MLKRDIYFYIHWTLKAITYVIWASVVNIGKVFEEFVKEGNNGIGFREF